MNWKTLEKVDQLKCLGIATNQRRNINKGSTHQTCASTQPLTRLAILGKKTTPSVFPTKLKLLQVTCLVNTVLGMWELDVDGGSGEVDPGLWKQMLQENVSSPDIRIFYCQPSSVASCHGLAMSVVVIRCRRSCTRTVDGSRHRGRPRKSRKDNIKEWIGQSMSLFLHIVDDRGRWAVIAADPSIGVPPTTPGVHGY